MRSILISSPGRCGMHWIADVLGDLTGLRKTKTRQAGELQYASDGAIMLTHDPITIFGDLVQHHKVICMVRDPRDVVVSAAYYWMAKPPKDRETPEEGENREEQDASTSDIDSEAEGQEESPIDGPEKGEKEVPEEIKG